MIAAVHFRKAAHAELVNSFVVDELRAGGVVRDDGWIDLPPAPIIERIGAAASELGSAIVPADAIERAAAAAVDQVLEHVARAKNEGGLKEVNLRYKLYRQRQVAKGEKAVNYATHLANFTLSLVVAAAQHGGSGLTGHHFSGQTIPSPRNAQSTTRVISRSESSNHSP